MNQEDPEIKYDQFFLNPVKERIKIFNEFSAGNRAFLVRTQAERWLAANRSRLDQEQVLIVDEIIGLISPELYKSEGVLKGVDRETEELFRRAEAVLSREDLLQFATIRAEYIPFGEDEVD